MHRAITAAILRTLAAGTAAVLTLAAVPAAVLTLAAVPAAATSPGGADPALITAIASMQSASSPAPSPDGRSFAFISNASGSPQVWVRRGTADPVQLTKGSDPVQSVRWSPKGDLLAYDIAPGGGYNIKIHTVRPDGTDDRIVVTPDGTNIRLFGWTDDGRLRVAVAHPDPAAFQAQLIDPATGAVTMVGKPAGSLGFPELSRDGRFAILEKLVTRGKSNLHLVDLRSGTETLLTPVTGLANHSSAGLSPDGRRLWLIQDSSQDKLALSMLSIDESGKPGAPQPVVARTDAELENAALSPDGSTLALVWNVGGRSELSWFDTASSNRSKGPRIPAEVITQVRFGNNGTLWLTGLGAAQATNIYTASPRTGEVARRTDSAHPGVDLATLVSPTLIEYKARDGVPLSGWLYTPHGVAKAGSRAPQPMVFVYHGGPEGQSRPTLSDSIQALVASGISVFAPNVRGSSGYGKAFLALDNGPLRVNGVRDIEDTTLHMVKAGHADANRLGIMGGSYGGYMVMAGVTEFPGMFAAGANLFGIVNFDTFFKQTQPWMAAISKVEYGDPASDAAMLKSLSPIHKLDRITTPLLVLHGANDTNVPVVEAEQIVANLNARNVPVGYILYPDEGHGWRKLPNRVNSTTEITNFFVKHLN
jgi:dipeptidyl aminopeptidase/acylaminoacyl peptidase